MNLWGVAMPRFAVFLLLALAACGSSDGARVARVDRIPGPAESWRFASGKPPTHAEYAAVVAACREGPASRAKGRPFDVCLADLGLRRAQ